MLWQKLLKFKNNQQIFSTYQDNTSISRWTCNDKLKDNKLLGKFDLNGIWQAPRGVPQIEVMGILKN